jgi:hypothetical protein
MPTQHQPTATALRGWREETDRSLPEADGARTNAAEKGECIEHSKGKSYNN